MRELLKTLTVLRNTCPHARALLDRPSRIRALLSQLPVLSILLSVPWVVFCHSRHGMLDTQVDRVSWIDPPSATCEDAPTYERWTVRAGSSSNPWRIGDVSETISVSVWKCLRCYCYCTLGFTMPPGLSPNSEFIIRSHRLLQYMIVEEATWQYHLDLLCLLYKVQNLQGTPWHAATSRGMLPSLVRGPIKGYP